MEDSHKGHEGREEREGGIREGDCLKVLRDLCEKSLGVFTDAHCHPFDLVRHFPAAEDERRRLGVMCAASATTVEEFEYCERFSQQADGALLLSCFAVHPQMPAVEQSVNRDEQLAALETLAAQGRLAAVGETGFDLYNAAFRETEQIQDELFAAHLETALRHDLPLVIHVRRAMHKIFAHAASLKKCRAVIFHSWPGTAGEGEALLRRGINAFFSFGNVIRLNHREAMRCCTVFPADRLLTETDAPFQPPRGKEFSCYADLDPILETMAALRRDAGTANVSAAEIERNFHAAFADKSSHKDHKGTKNTKKKKRGECCKQAELDNFTIR